MVCRLVTNARPARTSSSSQPYVLHERQRLSPASTSTSGARAPSRSATCAVCVFDRSTPCTYSAPGRRGYCTGRFPSRVLDEIRTASGGPPDEHGGRSYRRPALRPHGDPVTRVTRPLALAVSPGWPIGSVQVHTDDVHDTHTAGTQRLPRACYAAALADVSGAGPHQEACSHG